MNKYTPTPYKEFLLENYKSDVLIINSELNKEIREGLEKIKNNEEIEQVLKPDPRLISYIEKGYCPKIYWWRKFIKWVRR